MGNVFNTRHGQYKKPEMKIIPFDNDIIRTSNYGPDKDWDSDEFALGE